MTDKHSSRQKHNLKRLSEILEKEDTPKLKDAFKKAEEKKKKGKKKKK